MTRPDNLPDTRYARTLASRASWPRAEGTLKTEMAIIGGGLAGLTLARELGAAGKSPLLLETEAIGFGASGRNGGFVSPGYAAGHADIARRAGRQAADELFRISLEGVDYIRARAADYGEAAGIAKTDGILSVRRLPGNDELHRSRDNLAALGYETQVLDRQALHERVTSPKYHGALRSERAFHIHPLNYARALAADAARLGARLYEASPAEAVTRIHGGYLVTTDSARILADQVVITTGGYTRALVPALSHAYVPIATYVMTSVPDPTLLKTVLRTTDGVSDTRRANNYYRLIEGGQRLLWGGAISTRDRNPSEILRYLGSEVVSTHPQLAPLAFDVSWSGWMSYARHKMPQIGQHAPGLWYATAFGGHGLNTTAAAGCILAEAISGASDRWRRFAPWGLDWTGGAVGRLVAEATYAWLKWNDRRQEARA